MSESLPQYQGFLVPLHDLQIFALMFSFCLCCAVDSYTMNMTTCLLKTPLKPLPCLMSQTQDDEMRTKATALMYPGKEGMAPPKLVSTWLFRESDHTLPLLPPPPDGAAFLPPLSTAPASLPPLSAAAFSLPPSAAAIVLLLLLSSFSTYSSCFSSSSSCCCCFSSSSCS